MTDLADLAEMRVIEVVGGPLDGLYHEGHQEFPVPDRLGILGEDRKLHWHEVDHCTGKAAYVETIPARVPRDAVDRST